MADEHDDQLMCGWCGNTIDAEHDNTCDRPRDGAAYLRGLRAEMDDDPSPASKADREYYRNFRAIDGRAQ